MLVNQQESKIDLELRNFVHYYFIILSQRSINNLFKNNKIIYDNLWLWQITYAGYGVRETSMW